MKKIRKLNDYVMFALILLAVFVIWGGTWYWINNYIVAVPTSDTTAATRGQFGDQFGAVNALFSGLAFAGIIFTILLQRSDLAETRRAMQHERFDTTFFELLRLHMTITENVETNSTRGKGAFEAFHEILKAKDIEFHTFCALSKLDRAKVRTIIDSKKITSSLFPELNTSDINNVEQSLTLGVSALESFLDSDNEMHQTKIIEAYKRAADTNIDDFAHYFRNLYNILKFIDLSDQISIEEKNRYSKFVRSQLSEAELIVVFYNSIAKISLPGRETLELGHPKMAALLVKYDILQNMSPRSIIHPIHRTIFNKNTPKAGS